MPLPRPLRRFLSAVVACSTILSGAGSAVASDAAADRILGKLFSQLSSESYSERELAQMELQRLATREDEAIAHHRC